MSQKESIKGCLLGCAVGDALGLAVEGLSKKRQKKLFPAISRYNFFFNKGMFSDDTEHLCITAQALTFSAGNQNLFTRCLKQKLILWLLGLPAGIGFATLRATIKLLIGFSAHKSGVFSAGNGPAMRSPIIGVCFGHDTEKLKSLVKISTRITHTDPKAENGALAAAYSAYLSSINYKNPVNPRNFYNNIKSLVDNNDTEFLNLIKQVIESVEKGDTIEQFTSDIGLNKGVSGYIYHTIPVVLYCWLNNQNNFKQALLDIIHCGGDTDTTAAILGAIMGAGNGKEAIPEEWLTNIIEWPRSIKWIEGLADDLFEVCNSSNGKKLPLLPFYGIMLRNFFFTCIVLFHGFRRMFPPY